LRLALKTVAAGGRQSLSAIGAHVAADGHNGTVSNAASGARALEVLQLLARKSAPVSASVIARELGLPRSSLYHLLTVLTRYGFVAHLAEQRQYMLGIGAFELGAAYLRQGPLQRAGAVPLAKLADSTGHTAHLSVPHGREVVYLIEERARSRPPLVTDVGVRLPAQLTASGLAMLAAMPAAQVRALYPSRDLFLSRNGVGPMTYRELVAALVRVRKQGFANEDGFVSEGFHSIAVAVAVPDPNGYPLAAVALTFPADLGESERARLAPPVRKAAQRVADRLQGRW